MNIRMKHLPVALAVLMLTWLLHFSGAAEPAEPAADQEANSTLPAQGWDTHVKPFFKSYCVKCHGPDASKGGLSVHSLGGLAEGKDLDEWESILNMLESGEMPPIDEPQPKDAEVNAVVRWIESGIHKHAALPNVIDSEPKTRRLTNVEYENTLCELLGFELNVIGDLPEDPKQRYHFNNTAELMRIGPEQLDRYMEIARRAMRAAIVDPEKPEVYRWRKDFSDAGTDKGIGEDEVSVFGGARHFWNGIPMSGVPRFGEYRVRFSASAILPPGYEETPLRLNMGEYQGGDHNEKASKDIGTLYLTNSPDEPHVFEFRGRIENHPYSTELESSGVNKGQVVDKMSLRMLVIYDDGTLNDGAHYAFVRQLAMPRAVVNWVEFELPVVDTWPPTHHTDILFDSSEREEDEPAYVRAVLKRFMTRAYRRPATDQEIDRFTKIYNLVRPSMDSFEAAMRETLAMVLVSPRFLYHTESDPATDEHFAMASRLSYFLWASMPDEELFDLAAKKKLDDPAVIEQQVLRMLADDRSTQFVEDFTLQWLDIEKMLTVPINPQLYPRFLYRKSIGETAGTEMPYRPSTRDYMMQETVGFVAELIRRNASVYNIVDSDFAYINERLAVHYGIEGVKGMQMRPVPINPENNLGGLLTQGTVLIGNGTGTAPHPIYRAVWLREAILGDEVAPPPSDVPALEESTGESTEGVLSIAQLLAKHREKTSCNDCHFRLDPWGVPFEEYNAIGKYQPKAPQDGTRVMPFVADTHQNLAGYQTYLESINTVDVDATARLPHGPEVKGMRQLKDYLLKSRKDDIAENVVRRLLTYGIGRRLTYRDRFAVQNLIEETKENDFGIRDIIVSICKSEAFRD